jgi:hypothetical protein
MGSKDFGVYLLTILTPLPRRGVVVRTINGNSIISKSKIAK